MIKKVIKDNEIAIFEVLNKDLGKSETEAYMCEVGLTLDEISYMIKNIKKFAKEKIVPTPLTNFHSKSIITLYIHEKKESVFLFHFLYIF